MANRNFISMRMYSQRVPVMVDVTINIGASGAVSSISTTSLVKSVVRQSTGVYKINLADNYTSLIACLGSPQSPASGLSGIDQVETQNAPNASVSNLAAPSLTVKTLNASGALADPASGSAIAIVAIMQNSSVKA